MFFDLHSTFHSQQSYAYIPSLSNFPMVLYHILCTELYTCTYFACNLLVLHPLHASKPPQCITLLSFQTSPSAPIPDYIFHTFFHCFSHPISSSHRLLLSSSLSLHLLIPVVSNSLPIPLIHFSHVNSRIIS